jgi:hypothetical protein
MSAEDLAVALAQVRASSRQQLRDYLLGLATRGGMRQVASPDEVSPPEMRKLWDDDQLREVVDGIAPSAVRSARVAARIKALMCVVSEFTFTQAGGIKRRLESSEACEALERCGGGGLWGSAKARRARAGAGSLKAASDGRNG